MNVIVFPYTRDQLTEETKHALSEQIKKALQRVRLSARRRSRRKKGPYRRRSSQLEPSR